MGTFEVVMGIESTEGSGLGRDDIPEGLIPSKG